ncbi:hypothetical protein ACJX0J_008672, partial [Zea mays]
KIPTGMKKSEMKKMTVLIQFIFWILSNALLLNRLDAIELEEDDMTECNYNFRVSIRSFSPYRNMYKAFIAPHILKLPLKIKIFMWYLIKNIALTKDDLARKRWKWSINISSWIVLLLDAFGEGIHHMFRNWLNGVDDTLNRLRNMPHASIGAEAGIFQYI